jgi:hypothetical protein
MQTSHHVELVIRALARLGLQVSLYKQESGPDGNPEWIGTASYGQQRRRFQILNADTEPTILLLSYSESEKEIGSVLCSMNRGERLLLKDLPNNLEGVLRCLGLYRTLLGCHCLSLFDFKPFPIETGRPSWDFSVWVCEVDSLEPLRTIDLGSPCSLFEAHMRALQPPEDEKEWGQLRVVVDHQGCAVAVYYQSMCILTLGP